MAHFKLYLKALKKFSRAFILARDLFTFGHLLMITLYMHGRILTDRNAAHEKRIRVGWGLKWHENNQINA